MYLDRNYRNSHNYSWKIITLFSIFEIDNVNQRIAAFKTKPRIVFFYGIKSLHHKLMYYRISVLSGLKNLK